MEKYSEKLSHILGATGWSQEFLAGKLGVSFVSLNSWVNQKAEPRQSAKDAIDALALEVLGSSVVDKTRLVKLKEKALTTKARVRNLLKNRDLLDKITVSLTYHNNATEGSTMTEKDVVAVVYKHELLKNRTTIEQREAINHQVALYFLLDLIAEAGPDFELTPEIIKALHLRMMNGIISDAGNFRNHSVRIRGSQVPLANFIKIPDLIRKWCNLVNSETGDPIELLARSHAEFEKIHPFSDGNGRVGRLLLFGLALSRNIAPPILKKERRSAYYKYLEIAQTREETDLLEEFISVAILETAEILEDE